MTNLTQRIKAFLEREPPVEIQYVPGSLVEGLIATYATEGRLDSEGVELLGMCESDLADAVAARQGASADYFGECLAIVRAIQGEAS